MTAPNHPIEHPEWCDPARCTATPAAVMGEAHRGSPVTITAANSLVNLAVAGSLYQAHARWQTCMFVQLDVTGLLHDWQPVTGTATLTVEDATVLGRMLTDLAATAIRLSRPAEPRLPDALRKEVST
jgi:hypothetical protein